MPKKNNLVNQLILALFESLDHDDALHEATRSLSRYAAIVVCKKHKIDKNKKYPEIVTGILCQPGDELPINTSPYNFSKERLIEIKEVFDELWAIYFPISSNL
jgi:hypothetical protein